MFISYQRLDKDAAKKIADYLLGIGVDVYFDEYDSKLKFQNQQISPKEVTNAICDGINNSSHMLVLVSPTTLDSNWVPFEIGFGYDKTDLKVLCLRGIAKGSLPEYIRSVPVIRDIDDLNNVVAYLSGRTKEMLLEKRIMLSHNDMSNPLSAVMDTMIDDPY